jgi:glycosyltransferase involved in cell wall biosynthesis
MKVAVVVHGRFFAFELARALLARGHDVTVFTNYPRWAAARFGLPPARVRGCPVHGAMARLAWRARGWSRRAYPEAALHRLFGRWAASGVAREDWDVLLAWSGVAEEVLAALRGRGILGILVRGSAHIRAQSRLLEEEAVRTGADVDRPSGWMIAREEREYALADRVMVLSSFARDTFVAEGVDPDRLCIIPPGVDVERFAPHPETIGARCRRIERGERLRVLNVGSFSLQKGMWDMARVVSLLDRERFEFRFVGSVAPEARCVMKRLRSRATFDGHCPESALPDRYAWGDVFVLPTIQDGYALVLRQAAASGLPILTTSHGAGRDLVDEGRTGWVLAARCAEQFAERLRWCDDNRVALSGMVGKLPERGRAWGWEHAVDLFEGACGTARGPEGQRLTHG